jgi:cobaltochelatase CobN
MFVQPHPILQLGHNFSVDLYMETVAHARLVMARVLGGSSYWPYGVERLIETCREHGIRLALLPGDDKPDAELARLSSVPPPACRRLWRYLAEGGPGNADNFLRCRGADRRGAEVGRARAVAAPGSTGRDMRCRGLAARRRWPARGAPMVASPIIPTGRSAIRSFPAPVDAPSLAGAPAAAVAVFVHSHAEPKPAPFYAGVCRPATGVINNPLGFRWRPRAVRPAGRCRWYGRFRAATDRGARGRGPGPATWR